MKVRLLITFLFILIICNASAQQWQHNGSTVRLVTTSNNVGIGLTTATEKLHVSGNILSTGTITGTTITGTTFIGTGIFQTLSTNFSLRTNTTTRLTILNSNGNVGINELLPLEKLHLNGSIRGDQAGALRVSSGNGTVDIGAKTSSFGNIDTDRASFLFNKKIVVNGGLLSSYDGTLSLQAAGNTGITVLTSGNVGIGTALTSNPNNYKLAVNGRIGAKEVQVETNSSSWPDFVFSRNYDLMSLDATQAFIKKYHHLPGVPSASEIEENGHKLAEMDIILLKKVEELTLYLLDLKQENEALKKKVEKLNQIISIGSN